MATMVMTNDEVGTKLTEKVTAMSENEIWQRVEELTTKTTDDPMTHEEHCELVKLLFGPEADLAD